MFATPVGRVEVTAGCLDGRTALAIFRTADLTTTAALLTADLTAAIAFGTGFFAVVVHVPADSFGLLHVVVWWQQPQSAVTLG